MVIKNNYIISRILNSSVIYKLKKIYIILFFLPFAIFLGAELRYDVNMPYWDDYDSVLNWLMKFNESGSFVNSLDLLFRQHNEHRIVFDRLVELVELHALGVVNFIYLDLFGFVGLILLVLVVSHLGKRSGLSNYAILPIPFFMLSFSQNNLISFSMASIQVYWAILFSFISFMFVTKRFDKIHMVIGFLFSVAASFTSAGGLIGFPAIIIYYVLNRMYRFAAFWLLGAAFIFWIYFIFFPYKATPIGIASHEYAFSHPFFYFKYVIMFLGNIDPLSRGAFILGLLLLCAIGFFFLRNRVRVQSWLFLASTFIIATAAADGLSRIILGMDASLSSRYTPFGAIFIVLMYIALIDYCKNKKYRSLVIIFVLLLSFLFYYIWFFQGILSLDTTQSLMEHQLVYPSQYRAYSIMKNSMNNRIFFPISKIYRNLPSSLPLHSRCLYHNGYLGNIDSLSTSGGLIHIKGWAALKGQGIPAAAVIVKVNGRYYPTWYNVPRPSIAKKFNNHFLYTGYKSTIEIPGSASGDCRVSVVVVGSNRAIFYESPIKKIRCK